MACLRILKYSLWAAMLCTICSCGRHELYHHKHYFYRMDTITQVTLVDRRSIDLSRVWRAIDSVLLDWERRFSVERESSEVWLLNSDSRCTVRVSVKLADMVRTALRYSDTLDGDFDISVLPLKRIWGLDELSVGIPEHRIPTEQEVAEARKHVGWRQIKVDPREPIIYRPRNVVIDVGGIAKGYVLIEIGNLLENMGVHDYLISSGGDIQVSGRRKDGTPWVIGIQHPRNRELLLATLHIKEGCIVTSGDYERFWITPDGLRIHHIFSPHTGYSCRMNQSVTIWGKDPVEADVLSTGLFCRSATDILAFVNQRHGRLECAIVDSMGRIFVSAGWNEEFKGQGFFPKQ